MDGPLARFVNGGRAFTLFFRIAAAVACVLLTVLSLLPGSERPHTGASGNVEHVIAYALCGLVTRLGFADRKSRHQLLLFSVAAGFFELCQIWTPGRSAGVDNWLASAAGALLGIGVGRFYCHWIEAPDRSPLVTVRPRITGARQRTIYR